MKLKEKLCEAIRIFQIDNGISNQEIYDNTSITKTQLHYIKNCSGDNVSFEKLEELLVWMGYEVDVEFNDLWEGLDDKTVDFYSKL